LKEGPGGITGMLPCGQFLEMYKIDKTFRIQSPENIDPEQTNPNAFWLTTPVSDDGSKNPIIARIMLQGHEILKAAWFQHEVDKQEITLLLHTCKENLIACDKTAKKVAAEVDKIILKIQTEGIATEKSGRGLNPFPHVNDLTTDCDTFLTKTKRTIKSICELPSAFFTLPNENRLSCKFLNTSKELLKNLRERLKFSSYRYSKVNFFNF
jgi:hypothetical protein